MNNPNESEIGAKISYHPYYFGSIFLDAEWSRRHHYREGAVDIAQSFKNARKAVQERCENFLSGIKKFAEVTGQSVDTNPEGEYSASDELYQPYSFLPLGHSDIASLLLFDDIDIIQALSAHAETSVEEVTFGICPTASSIAPDKGWLIDPHIFLRKHLKKEHRGFTTLTSLKLHGSITIGTGISMEKVFYTRLVEAIEETLATIKEQPEIWEPFEVTSEEANHFSVSLVNLLGQEELGILIHCKNLSLGHAILARIQNIRLRSLVSDTDPGFGNQKWINDLIKFYKSIEQSPKLHELDDDLPTPISILGAGHVLRWVKTTVLIPDDIVTSSNETCPPDLTVSGYVEPVSDANLCVGHQLNFEKALNKIRSMRTEPKSILRQFFGNARSEDPLRGKARIYRLGSTDAAFRHKNFDANDSQFVVSSKRFISEFPMLLNVIISSDDSGQGEAVRNVVDLVTHLQIPIPLNLLDKKGDPFCCPEVKSKGHNNILEIVLPVLRWRLFGSKAVRDQERMKWSNPRNEAGPYDAGLIEDCLRANSGPCRTLGSLFQNYATFLGNPYLFDAVLDLFDPISTLHNQVRALNDRASKWQGDPYENSASSKQLDLLTECAKTLHGSMVHRMHRAFPEQIYREVDIDFRGGLNQVIYAADSVLKIAAGFLRYFVLPKGTKSKISRRDRVGVISHVTPDTGIAIDQTRIGVEDEGRMAIVRFDVPHAMHPVSWVELFIESFHMIYSELRNPADPKNSETQTLLPLVPVKSLLNQKMSEIFSTTLACLVIDRRDPTDLLRHLTIASATSSTLAGLDVRDRREGISGWLVNLYLVECNAKGEGYTNSGFKDFFLRAIALFPYSSWLEIKEPYKKQPPENSVGYWRSLLEDQFAEFTQEAADYYESMITIYGPYSRIVGKAARKIFESYVERVKGSLKEGESLANLNSAVIDKLESGESVLWNHVDYNWLSKEATLKADSDQPKDTSILSGVVTAATLRWMVRKRSERVDPQLNKFYNCYIQGTSKTAAFNAIIALHLPRTFDNRSIDWQFLRDPIFKGIEFLIDRNRMTLFSRSLEDRSQRVLEHILGAKTLAGVSARMKERRFSDMLKRVQEQDEFTGKHPQLQESTSRDNAPNADPKSQF